MLLRFVVGSFPEHLVFEHHWVHSLNMFLNICLGGKGMGISQPCVSLLCFGNISCMFVVLCAWLFGSAVQFLNISVCCCLWDPILNVFCVCVVGIDGVVS